MKTHSPKPESVVRKWFVLDASGVALGRVASRAAAILIGKNKPIYTPHVDTGDHVIIINCDKAVLTGKKLEQKFYRRHSGYVGNLREIQYKHLMATRSDFAMKKAVKGMLPKNALAAHMLKKLRVYKGAEHRHAAQMPEILEIKGR